MAKIQTSSVRYTILKVLFNDNVRTHSRLLGEFFKGSTSHLPALTLEMSFTSVCMPYTHLSFSGSFDLKARKFFCLTTNSLSNFLKNEASHISKGSRFLILSLKVAVLIFRNVTSLSGITSKIYHANLERYSYFLKHRLSHHNGIRSLLLVSVHTAVTPTGSVFPAPSNT